MGPVTDSPESLPPGPVTGPTAWAGVSGRQAEPATDSLESLQPGPVTGPTRSVTGSGRRTQGHNGPMDAPIGMEPFAGRQPAKASSKAARYSGVLGPLKPQ